MVPLGFSMSFEKSGPDCRSYLESSFYLCPLDRSVAYSAMSKVNRIPVASMNGAPQAPPPSGPNLSRRVLDERRLFF